MVLINEKIWKNSAMSFSIKTIKSQMGILELNYDS